MATDKGYFLDVKGARPFFDITKDDLKKSVEGLINKAENLSEADKIKVCNFLSNGGLPGDCARAIRQDPGKGATPHEAASAMTILARAYNGEKFKGLEIKPNKPKAKFIFKNFSELGMDNPWTMSLYDEGLRQVDRDLKNKVGTFAKFKKDYTYEMNKLLKDLGIKKKFNINEITSVKASRS